MDVMRTPKDGPMPWLRPPHRRPCVFRQRLV